jgi:hypothetical protein
MQELAQITRGSAKLPAAYRFAINSRNRVCSVETLKREGVPVLGPFRCVDCGEELIPRLGKKNIRHFAHTSESNCSRETYLHKLGKRLFIETYSDCVKDSRAFTLGLITKHQCVTYEDQLDFSCEFERIQDYDITAHFDDVAEEAPFGGFTPDVLLRSTTSGEVIFVEIAVSHPCTQEKIGSGHRIIEFTLQSEEDADLLLGGVVKEGTANVVLFNFKPKAIRGRFCSDDCVHGTFSYFVVDRRGNASVLTGTPSDIAKEIGSPNIVFSAPGGKGDVGNQLRSFVKKAVQEGISVRSCFACEFLPDEGSPQPAFCRKSSRAVSSSEAFRCRLFSQRKP